MDRRDFLRRGTTLAALVATRKGASGYEQGETVHAGAELEAGQEEAPRGSLVTTDELDSARQWGEAITENRRRQGGEWLENWLGTELPFSFRYGGEPSQSLLSKWHLRTREAPGNSYSHQTELTWNDPGSGLEVEWDVKRFTDFPAIEWTLWFANRGDKDTLLLEGIHDLDLRLNRTTEEHPFILHGAHGGRYKTDDWWPFSQYLPATVTENLPQYESPRDFDLGDSYPSSRRHLPFFNLESPESRGVIVGIGWTGNWVSHFHVDKNLLTARAGLKETHFLLHPGERVRTARVLLLLWKGNYLHGQNVLRRLLHQHYIPFLHGSPREPLLSLNTCFSHDGKGAFLEQANEKNLLPDVQPFIQVGGEAFIIDAGWYGMKRWTEGMGDWTYCKEKYPNGFRPISEPLKAAGAAFGIWFAPEIVNEGVPLMREHPEWIRVSPRSGYLSAGGGALRLELPEAREWFLNQVEELIDKQGMTLYRQDGDNQETDLREGEPEDRKGVTEIQYIMGLYALEDELRRRHPELIMEAALGAPRIDLETISRFHWHQPCESWLHPTFDQCQTYGISLWLPGGSFVFYNQSMDDYGLWSGFGGQLSVAWEPSAPSFPQKTARRQISLYKRIRPYLGGDFYPLTPISMDGKWMGYQFHRTDLNSGCAFVFKRQKSPEVLYPESDSFRLRLSGLARSAQYRVRYESAGTEKVISASGLKQGLDIALNAAPSAELITYQPA